MSGELFHILGLPVTGYALALAVSVLLVFLAARLGARKAGVTASQVDVFFIFALPLCLLLARLVFVLVRLPFFLDRADGLALRAWQGGYTIWGVFLGFFLAALIASRVSGSNLPRLLDHLAGPGLLLVALTRFAEGLSGQGYGGEAAIHFFPLAVENEWGEWRWAVFMLEGAAALLFFFLVNRHKGRPGSKAILALTFYCAFQMLFESLREDEYLVWGFVRVTQLFSALTLAGLTARGLFGGARKYGWQPPRHLAISGFMLCILLIIILEFALDKTAISSFALYGAMLLACVFLFRITYIASVREAAQPPQMG